MHLILKSLENYIEAYLNLAIDAQRNLEIKQIRLILKRSDFFIPIEDAKVDEEKLTIKLATLKKDVRSTPKTNFEEEALREYYAAFQDYKSTPDWKTTADELKTYVESLTKRISLIIRDNNCFPETNVLQKLQNDHAALKKTCMEKINQRLQTLLQTHASPHGVTELSTPPIEDDAERSKPSLAEIVSAPPQNVLSPSARKPIAQTLVIDTDLSPIQKSEIAQSSFFKAPAILLRKKK